MPVGLAAALAGGVVSALFYLSVFYGGLGALILGYLAPWPLFLVGLWLGAGAAGIAGGLAGALVFVGSGSAFIAAAYLLTALLPVWLVVRQALLARARDDGTLEWYPPGRLLLALTGLGVAAILLAAALTAGETDGLEGVVRDGLAAMGGMLASPGETPDDGADIFWLARAIPGTVAVSWTLMTVINGALAQGVLMRFGRNRRPGMRLVEIDLPQWSVMVFAGLTGSAMALPDPLGYLALNAALVMAIPFAFAGLAVVHAFARSRSARMPILVGFYMFLVLFGWPIALMVGLGVIEQWTGWRRRWTGGPPQEDE